MSDDRIPPLGEKPQLSEAELRRQSDRLVIKTLRMAIVCAWIVMLSIVASAFINACGQRRCECPTAERP